MNLWAKSIRQLVALPIALFFFSCEDEASLLGYKNPNPKFDVSYVEIPIESSILLLDSQRTSNYIFQGEINRLLVGQYNDDQFGSVVANCYTQFFTTSTTKLPAEATYDSVSLTLLLDFYNYGNREPSSEQKISVFELSDSLQSANRRYYFNRSEIPVYPAEIGSQTFTVNLDSLDHYSSSTDTVFRITIPLDATFGKRLFDEAIDYAGGSDNTFITHSLFTKLFKGLSIKSTAGDKILGVQPTSQITLHYHTPTTDSLGIALSFFGLPNFTQITGDRSATSLAGLTQYSQDFIPGNDLRYLQSGLGVYTKLDFANFFSFCDTVPNLIISSAELSIDGVQQSSYPPPPTLAVNIVNGSNNYKEKYSRKNDQDNADLLLYNPAFPAHTRSLLYETLQNVVINEADSAFYLEGDRSPEMEYSSTSKKYSGSYTLYFQQLAITAEGKRRFQYYLLTPSGPGSPSTKTVNRVVFPKENIKLKIHYTKPTTPLN